MLTPYSLKLTALRSRGVAQLAEHRSPKPGVESSSLSAPAGFVAQAASLSEHRSSSDQPELPAWFAAAKSLALH